MLSEKRLSYDCQCEILSSRRNRSERRVEPANADRQITGELYEHVPLSCLKAARWRRVSTTESGDQWRCSWIAVVDCDPVIIGFGEKVCEVEFHNLHIESSNRCTRWLKKQWRSSDNYYQSVIYKTLPIIGINVQVSKLVVGRLDLKIGDTWLDFRPFHASFFWNATPSTLPPSVS